MPMARLSAQAHSKLQEIAGRRGQSQQDVLEAAISLFEKKQFFEEAHRAYAELRQNSGSWRELETERALLDGSVGDGIGSDPF
jgi:predicted transcriptional regulator